MSPEQRIALEYQNAFRDKRAARAKAMRLVRASLVDVSQLAIKPDDSVFEPTPIPVVSLSVTPAT
jgi:hypothetical protein